MGISPVATRSDAGNIDSTKVGFIAAKFFGHDLVQAAQPLDRGHVQRRIGHHQHPFVFWIDEVFDRLRGIFRFDQSLVINDTDDAVASDRAEAGVDLILGILFRRRRIVWGKHAVIRHDNEWIGVIEHDIVAGFSGAIFGHRPIHHAHRRGAPILSGYPGLLAKRLDHPFDHRSLERAVDHDLAAFFLCRFYDFGILSEDIILR